MNSKSAHCVFLTRLEIGPLLPLALVLFIFLIENKCFSHILHPNHSFPFLHPLPSLHPTPIYSTSISLQKRAGLQEATPNITKQNPTRQGKALTPSLPLFLLGRLCPALCPSPFKMSTIDKYVCLETWGLVVVVCFGYFF